MLSLFSSIAGAVARGYPLPAYTPSAPSVAQTIAANMVPRRADAGLPDFFTMGFADRPGDRPRHKRATTTSEQATARSGKAQDFTPCSSGFTPSGVKQIAQQVADLPSERIARFQARDCASSDRRLATCMNLFQSWLAEPPTEGVHASTPVNSQHTPKPTAFRVYDAAQDGEGCIKKWVSPHERLKLECEAQRAKPQTTSTPNPDPVAAFILQNDPGISRPDPCSDRGPLPLILLQEVWVCPAPSVDTPDAASERIGLISGAADNQAGMTAGPVADGQESGTTANHRGVTTEHDPSVSGARAPRAASAQASAKQCFVSIGDFDVPHPEAVARQSMQPDRRTGAWSDDPWIGLNDGLNTYGYETSAVTSIKIGREDVRDGRIQSYECAGGQLYQLRVPVPDGALGILRVRAESPGRAFEMQVRTGGDACEGIHRVMPCDPDQRDGFQCDVTFEHGQVDGSDSIVVELFSKTDARIDFRAQ